MIGVRGERPLWSRISCFVFLSRLNWYLERRLMLVISSSTCPFNVM